MQIEILLVEDYAPMREALAELLRLVYPRASIAEAANGAEALALARERAPRLVLLDIGLPDGNGLELIPGLRTLAPQASVVVVSQHDAPAYVERALGAGACAHVAKCRVTRELLPALERALEEKR